MNSLDVFAKQVEQSRLARLSDIDRIPISALIWGPNPSSGAPLGVVRQELRDALAHRGHLAHFSEDLYDPASTRSPLAQQVAQAMAYDIVLTVPGSFGSIAELHDFARLPGLSHKVNAFLDRSFVDGYSSQTLMKMETSLTCQLHWYEPADLPTCITEKALNIVERLQEIHFLMGRGR